MKLITSPYLLFAALLFAIICQAQNYKTLTVATGFNHDVIANGTAMPLVSTTNGIDYVANNQNYALISADYNGSTGLPALPNNGTIYSTSTQWLMYQLAPYDQNNSLRINTPNGPTSVTFATPFATSKVYLLVTSGTGPSVINYTLNFADGTTQTQANIAVPDWLEPTGLPAAYFNLSRVQRDTGMVQLLPSAIKVILYEISVDIAPANQLKLLSGITFNNLSNQATSCVFNFFAATAVNNCNPPAAPTASTQTFCNSGTVAGLAASGLVSGANYKWYASEFGSDPLPPNSPLSTGTYYVSQLTGTCESNKTAVSVIVNSATAPIVPAAQSVCAGATISSLTATPLSGSTINWYNSNNDLLNATTVLTSSGVYYATQTINGCESPSAQVNVIVNSVPNAPTGANEQTVNEGDTSTALTITTVNGANVKWYTKNDTGIYTALNPATVLIEGVTYYATQSTNNCESNYFAVKVTKIIKITPVYEPVTITSGFNQDVIASGIGDPALTSTTGVDTFNFVLTTTDFQLTADAALKTTGLPPLGIITSAATPGVTYKFAPYTGNNSLKLSFTDSPGTLVFATPVTTSKLYMLVTCGSGFAKLNYTINFSDGSTQSKTDTFVPDWLGSPTSATPIAITNLARIERNQKLFQTFPGLQLYEASATIAPANQTKQIVSITFSNMAPTTSYGVTSTLNIFAVTAEAPTLCTVPNTVSAIGGVTTATLNWVPAITPPATGYDYYCSANTTPPNNITLPTGTVSAEVSSVPIYNLTANQSYTAWVRSNCGNGTTSPWRGVAFTNGSVSATYTNGDISSSYYNGNPASLPKTALTTNAVAATDCSGTLSLTIPNGYKLSSLATSYTISSVGTGNYTSQQRSYLSCPTMGTKETAITSGTGNTTYFQTYTRNNLTFANGATGTVNFELHAMRTNANGGNLDCGTTYAKVDDGTWTITATYDCITPATPTAITQLVCNGSTYNDIIVNGLATGATTKWYASASAAGALTNTDVVAAGTYYVSQIVGDCESNRTTVKVETANLANVFAPATLNFCTGATVADLHTPPTSPAYTIAWHATATGDALPLTTPLTNGVYYVTQSYKNCISTPQSVIITIGTQPQPQATATQNFCESENATVANLSATPATGATITWRATATGTTLPATTLLATGTYYVTQTLDCTSEPKAIEVIINKLPNAPTGAAEQNFTEGATIADFIIVTEDGATTQWYIKNDAGEYTKITTTTAVVNGTMYYATQSTNNCESDYLAVKANKTLGNNVFIFSKLTMYPNPAFDVVTISNNTTINHITITNMLGQILIDSKVNATSTTLSTGNLSSGTYLVQVQMGKNSKILKLIKQ